MSRSHDNLGVGAGEGLAAVCGHQSGGEGTWAAMPSSSPGDQSNRIIRFRFPASTPFSFRARGTRAPTDAARAGRVGSRRQDGGFPS